MAQVLIINNELAVCRAHRTFLILPDNDEETFSNRITLNPRFISYMDINFEDVAVLAKMIEQRRFRDQVICQGHVNGIQNH